VDDKYQYVYRISVCPRKVESTGKSCSTSNPLRYQFNKVRTAKLWRLCRVRHRRHTTATHLLRGGVDINTIRAWLGHVSLETTLIYAEIDLATKAKALAHCEITPAEPHKSWREDAGLLAFLRAL
jgi:integrase